MALRHLQGIRIAFQALVRNRLRTSLTALGIIIGVAAVVAMVAVGNGARASVQSKVAALGQNVLTVFAGSRRSGGVNAGLGSASVLTLDDAHAIQREIQLVAALSPEVTSAAQVVANGRNWSTTIAGESEQYLHIRSWSLSSGAMFGEHDVRAGTKVALIGSKTAAQLFGPTDPVGLQVRVKNIPFSIIGVLSSKGAGVGGQNQDDRLIIPYTTAMRRLTGERYLRSISVQVVDDSHMAAAQDQISQLLRQRHRLGPQADADFNILSQKEIAETVESITGIITALLGAIAGISLLVGGIGIMNIMLVSVTERTREIGVRMAVGATGNDIRWQFLVESVALCLVGGAAGVALGMAAAKAVSLAAGFDALVGVSTVVLAFSVSFMIGVFFGLYPAQRAANMDPIAALRFE